MSSRSLAAARSRRAGENAPPVSGNRPGTSIGSYAAFGQQPVNLQQNVRVSRGQQPPQNMYQQPPQQQQNMYQQPPQQQQQQQQQPQQKQNGLPFTKLNISDAIGLITIRLGRVEQWIIETDHENEINSHSNLSDGSKTIDNSVLTNFASRLDSLEKREPTTGNNFEEVTKLSEEINKMNLQLAKIVEESSKHSLTTAKHTEQLFKFERELVETKDILKTFMLKYDMFASETNDKFGDFEFAISDLEKNFQISEQINMDGNEETEDTKETEDTEDTEDTEETEVTKLNETHDTQNSIMSVNLKHLIKQELAGINE
jgi:hypothetical protein